MVDLHQTEPGLRADHPWLALSRWGIAWRSSLALLAVTMLGLAVLGLAFAEDQILLRTFLGPAGQMTLLVTPTLGAILAFALGPWLRRYYPFGQALLFGGINAAVTFVLTLGWGVVEAILEPCEPETAACGNSIGWASVFAMFYCPPAFLACAAAYPLAIWATTRRGSRVFWPVLAAATVLFVTLWLLVGLGVFAPTADHPAPTELCEVLQQDGSVTAIPCEELSDGRGPANAD